MAESTDNLTLTCAVCGECREGELNTGPRAGTFKPHQIIVTDTCQTDLCKRYLGNRCRWAVGRISRFNGSVFVNGEDAGFDIVAGSVARYLGSVGGSI